RLAALQEGAEPGHAALHVSMAEEGAPREEPVAWRRPGERAQSPRTRERPRREWRGLDGAPVRLRRPGAVTAHAPEVAHEAPRRCARGRVGERTRHGEYRRVRPRDVARPD